MTTIEHVRAKLALLSWCASSVGDVSPHILSRRMVQLSAAIEKLRFECMLSTRRDESIEQRRIGEICLVGEEISEPVVEVKVRSVRARSARIQIIPLSHRISNINNSTQENLANTYAQIYSRILRKL